MTDTRTQAHTAGKLYWNDNWLQKVSPDAFDGLLLYYTTDDDGLHGEEADKQRLVDCWNALDGLNPDAIADVVAALREVQPILHALARPPVGRPVKTNMELWAECLAAEKRCRDALAKLEAQS